MTLRDAVRRTNVTLLVAILATALALLFLPSSATTANAGFEKGNPGEACSGNCEQGLQICCAEPFP